MERRITDLPSRYEPLAILLGDKAKTTLIEQKNDLTVIKRLLARIESSSQGKIIFLFGKSGVGKTTFVNSLEVFLSDKIEKVVNIPPQYDLTLADTAKWISGLPDSRKIKVVNFDAREAPSFDEKEYRTFLVQLNAILRRRSDILVVWPINDKKYGESIVEIITQVGGKSAFGRFPIYDVEGLAHEQYKMCLEKILQVANWTLDDAAISWAEVESAISSCDTIGMFLDKVQELVSERLDIDSMGVDLPKIVFVLTSSLKNIREICRGLRRADSYYVEATRLLMYTKRSNVAEWWAERSRDQRTSLPYIVALFNAQLITVSGSGVVHSIMQFGNDDLKVCTASLTANKGNARRVIESSELYKYSLGIDVDNREYGLPFNDETQKAYSCIQQLSKKNHKAINQSIMEMVKSADGGYSDFEYESEISSGLFADVVVGKDPLTVIEFHHKSESECTYNKVSIYLLEKLKEYAINYQIVPR